ncbi:MAG: hypothetical protein AAGA40_13095 [Cyanobacteria bacterium P01_E01_bin.45]
MPPNKSLHQAKASLLGGWLRIRFEMREVMQHESLMTTDTAGTTQDRGA